MLIPYGTDAPIYHLPFATVGMIVLNAIVSFAAWSLTGGGWYIATNELGETVPVVEEMDREAAANDPDDSGPTYFEITTAMALLQFARRGTDAAVLEVGLGGRLDSTNACQPRVTVITSISYDHMAQLGDTLELIAAEKAGIIKPGVPMVSGSQKPEAPHASHWVQSAADWHCTHESASSSQISSEVQGVAPLPQVL